MKGNSLTARLLSTAWWAIGPALVTALPWAVWTPVSRGMETGHIPGGWWVWLLLPPGLAVEWWASRRIDRQPPGSPRRVLWLIGLIARLMLLCVGFFLLVGRTAALLGTPDIFAPLVGLWPIVASMPYIESPVVGAVGAMLLATIHVLVTVRHRIFRMTTTLILPAAFTMVLFQFYYAFPTNPLHFRDLRPDEPVEQVYPFQGIGRDGNGAPFMAREIYVTPDERTIIASYGVTFQFFHPGKDVNLARIDLTNRTVMTHEGRVIRTFRTTCPDRLYAAPWAGSTILEIDPATFEISEFELPDVFDGQPVEEIHGVVHDCERHRVVVANSRNPVIFVWNTQTRAIEKTIPTSGIVGTRMGDHVIPLAIDPSTHAVYVVSSGSTPVIALSPDGLEPFKFVRNIEFPFDMSTSADGKSIYVSSFVSGHVWGIDAASMAVTKTFSTPLHCRRVDVSPDGRTLYVLSYLTGELLAYDTESTRLLSRRWIGPKPEGMFVSANYVWVSAATGIFRLPLSEMRRSR